MKGFIHFLAVLIALGFLGRADGAVILQTATYDGHTYHLVANTGGTRITWADAEAFAVTLGGHLVTINDAAENTFVLNTFGPAAAAAKTAAHPAGGLLSLWLGLNDAASEGVFVWVSGAPVGFTNWETTQPNGSVADEDFVGMIAGPGFGSPGQWHDIVSDFRFDDVTYGVVEVPRVPEPASILAFGLAGLALLGCVRRRRAAA